MTAEFLLTALIVVLIPGTGVLYTVAAGLGQGRAQSISAAFGCTLGIVPHIVASSLGLAAILNTSAVIFQGFKFTGAAYLLYLAWQTLKDSGPLNFEASNRHSSHYRIARTGFLINILNPKLSIFFLAFLPQFIPASSAGKLRQMLELGAIFMAMTFMVFIVYGLFAAHIRECVLASKRVMNWIRRISALAFATLGLRLAMEKVI